MRKTIIAVLIACFIMPTAGAQQAPAPRVALQDFVGEYVLSNGRVLTISQKRQVLTARLDGQDPVALQPAGPASFAARSGDLRIDFDQRPNGNVAGLSLTGGGAKSAMLARR